MTAQDAIKLVLEETVKGLYAEDGYTFELAPKLARALEVAMRMLEKIEERRVDFLSLKCKETKEEINQIFADKK